MHCTRTCMIISVGIIFKIRNLTGKFAEQLKTHILCSVTFSETGTSDKKMCTVLYR